LIDKAISGEEKRSKNKEWFLNRNSNVRIRLIQKLAAFSRHFSVTLPKISNQ